MAIAYKDFRPQVQRKRMIAMMSEYENLPEIVTRVNYWIEREQVRVLNVETLLIPALPPPEAEEIGTRMDGPTNTMSLYQVVRVWYEGADVSAASYTGATTRLDIPATSNE